MHCKKTSLVRSSLVKLLSIRSLIMFTQTIKKAIIKIPCALFNFLSIPKFKAFCNVFRFNELYLKKNDDKKDIISYNSIT